MNRAERHAQLQRDIAAQRQAVASRALDVRGLMKLREFRRFIYAELASCGLNADTTDTQNVNQNYVNAGRRSYAVNLAREVEALDQEGYLLMLREAMQDRATKQAEE
jgi:hypothetical protein